MTVKAKPQWIAKMYPGKSGLDHLGLGSVSSDQILPTLSPSINVLTFHPRYHSFYTFLLYEYWQTDRPRSRQSWVKFYRPREFIFSVGANMCDQPEHGEMGNIVGSQKTQSLARTESSFDTTYHYIDTELGGYGLYYRAVIAEMGLIYPGGRGFKYPVDAPTKLGEEIALAFRSGVENSEYYQDYFAEDETEVPRDVVLEYIRKACLCRLQTEHAQERPRVIDTFLAGGLDPESRRSTIRMFLDLAVQTEGNALDQDAFRQLVYYGASDTGAEFAPKWSNASTHLQWRLYQAREYYSLALNALWNYFCVWGLSAGGDLQPKHYSDFSEHLRSIRLFEDLALELGIEEPGINLDSSFRKLLEWVEQGSDADDSQYMESYSLEAQIHEHKLYKLITIDFNRASFSVAGALAILALVYGRFSSSDLRYRDEWAISQMGHDGRLSVDGFIRELKDRLASGPVEIHEILDWLYRTYIIRQHLMVASRKMPDNTYRFSRERGGMRFYPHSNPIGFMNSRFDAISTTLLDLGLCGDIKAPSHELSNDGKRLLETGAL